MSTSTPRRSRRRSAPEPPPTAAARTARLAGGARSRAAILDVAERLFAEHGVDGVSLRAINAAAGFGPAAVNYHFGGRADLVRAIVERRFAPVIEAQVARLEVIEATRAVPTTEQLVEVIAVPFFALLDAEPEGGLHWLRLATRLVQENDPLVTRRGRPDLFEERLLAQLRRRHPGCDDVTLVPCWRLAILSLMTLLAASADEFDRSLVVRHTARGFDGMCEPA